VGTGDAARAKGVGLVVVAVVVGAVVVVVVLLDVAHECLGSPRACVCPWLSAVGSIVGMRGWKSR